MAQHSYSDQQLNDLASSAAQGDELAVSALYQEMLPRIYRFLAFSTQDQDAAEDLTASTFLQMVKSIRKFSSKGNFRNWLYTIAKRELNHWIRDKYRLPTTPLALVSESSLIANTADSDQLDNDRFQKGLINSLESVWQQLPAQMAEVVKLRFLESKSVQEVATAIGFSPANVKVITHRAIKKIKQIVTT